MVGEMGGGGVAVCEEEGWPEAQKIYVLGEQSISESDDGVVGGSGSRRSAVAGATQRLTKLGVQKKLPWSDEEQDRARGGKKAGGGKSARRGGASGARCG